MRKKMLYRTALLASLLGALFMLMPVAGFASLPGAGDIARHLTEVSPGTRIQYGDYNWKLTDPASGELLLSEVSSSRQRVWGSQALFNPGTAGSVAEYLNTDFYNNLFTYSGTPEQLAWIQNYNWPTTDNNPNMTVQAKVGLLSKDRFLAIKDSLLGGEVSETFPYRGNWYLMTSSVTGSVYYVSPYKSLLETSALNEAMIVRPVIHVNPDLFALSDGDGGYKLAASIPMPEHLSDARRGAIVKFADKDWIVTDPLRGELLLKDSLGAMPWERQSGGGGIYQWEQAGDLLEFKQSVPGTVAYYVNHDFYESLGANKKWIVPYEFDNTPLKYEGGDNPYAEYDSNYESHSVTANVGLLSFGKYEELRDDGVRLYYGTENKPWWMMNPIHGSSYVYWYIAGVYDGMERIYFYPMDHDVRPVIHLKEGFTVLSGMGSEAEPYLIMEPAGDTNGDNRLGIEDILAMILKYGGSLSQAQIKSLLEKIAPIYVSGS